jgi:hypothetical protein
VTFFAWLGATVHGLMSGSDTAATWAFWFYVAASAAVGFLLAYRLVLALARGQSGSTSAPSPAAPVR